MSPVAPFQPRTRILSFLIAVIAGGFWSLPGLASESPGGFWVGSAFFDGGGDMPLRFKIEHRNQAWSATFFALLQDAEPLPVQEIEWTAPRLEMTRVTASGKRISFTGQVENSTITGRVDWAGSGADLELFRTPEPLAEIPSSSYADCAGVYRISPERSVIVAPRFWGELVYTDLGTGGNATLFPLTDSTFFAGPGMLIPGPVVVRASFKRNPDGVVTHLIWEPNGEPSIHATKIRLHEEQINFQNEGTTISGTLIRPDGEIPQPAMVILGGSNWRSREVLRQKALIFASLGIASLIYDKRGYGESTGEETVSFDVTARDALAAVNMLRRRPDTQRDLVGLSGTSRGGWFAPLAASLSKDVGFLVLFVAPAVSPATQETTRRLNLMRAEGFSKRQIGAATEYLDRAWYYAKTNKEWSACEAAADNAESLGVPEFIFESRDKNDEEWVWNSLNMHYNPVNALEHVTCPVLAIYGERDNNVVPAENVPILKAALSRAGNRDVTTVIIPGANHGLRHTQELRDGYHQATRYPAETWSSVTSWLLDRLEIRE